MSGHATESKNVSINGYINGLLLTLFIEDPYSIFSMSTAKGAHVYVHNKSKVPSIFDGLSVPTGKQAKLVIKRIVSKRLAKPYSECVDDIQTYKSPLTEIFSKHKLEYRQTE